MTSEPNISRAESAMTKRAKVKTWMGIMIPKWLPTGITAITCITVIWTLGCWKGGMEERVKGNEMDIARLRATGSEPLRDLSSQVASQSAYTHEALTDIKDRQIELKESQAYAIKLLLDHIGSRSQAVADADPNGRVY